MVEQHNITLSGQQSRARYVHRTLLKLLSCDDRVEHINVVASAERASVCSVGVGR